MTEFIDSELGCLSEDFNKSYLNFGISLNDCYRIELIREILKSFEVLDSDLGIVRLSIQTQMIEYADLELRFRLHYSLNIADSPVTETVNFSIFTRLSS